MEPRESLEQTLLKLRERVAFLERANQTLGNDRRRMLEEVERVEQMLGGFGGLSLSGAVASRLAREDRIERKRIGSGAAARAAFDRKRAILAAQFPSDTGAISDDVFAELTA